MNIKPIHSGGRSLHGSTPYGDYHIEVFRDYDGPVYDANGEQVGTVKMTIKAPPPPSPKQFTHAEKARLAMRIKSCAGCENLIKFGQGIVHCKKVDCKTCRKRRHALDMSEESSVCPEGKWTAME